MGFEGILNINKPAGITSYDVIRTLKKIHGKVKIGHAGTLDPFATGVLIVAVGKKYTKQLATFQNLPKTYRFTIQLGKTTTTLDPEGDIVEEKIVPTTVTKDVIQMCTANFKGDIEQVPPQFSAKKINGKRAYKLARQGEQVNLEPSSVSIYSIECLDYNAEQQQIDCRITCSKGTYVRSLSRDIALALNTVGYTATLVREAIGEYRIENSKLISELEAI